MFTAIDFSLILIGSTVGGNAAREGARVGIINYECADSSCSLDHNGNPVNNYGMIVTAVNKLLGSLVRGTPTTTVRCLDVDTLGTKNCQFGTIDLDRDLIEVKVVWQHIGASPFVSNASHTETARMVISGKPDIAATGATTTSTTTSTSTTTTAPGPTTTTTTAAPKPTISTLQFFDTDTDGKVDRVTAGFSMALTTGNPCKTTWTLTGVPSGGSLDSVSISGSSATLTLNEGGGAPDTAVGAFLVSFAPSATCNANPFSNLSPADEAGPVPVSIAWGRGATPGKMEVGDSVSITFSEAMGNVPAQAAVTETDGNKKDDLTLSGISSGPSNTNGDYVGSGSATYPGAMGNVPLSADLKTVTVTVAGTCTGTCGANIKPDAAGGNWTYTPAAGLTDQFTNPVAGSLAGNVVVF